MCLRCQLENLGLFSHFLTPIKPDCRRGIIRHFFSLPVNYFLSVEISLKLHNAYPIKYTSLLVVNGSWQKNSSKVHEIIHIKQNNQTFICIPFTLRKVQHSFNIRHILNVVFGCKDLKRVLSQQQMEA